jgi:hypothetical protein
MEMEMNPNATTVTTAPPTTTHRQYRLRARNGAYGGRVPVSAGCDIAIETTWPTETARGEKKRSGALHRVSRSRPMGL